MKQQNRRRNSGNLIDAVKKQNYKAAKNLLRRGRNANDVDYDGNTPLHYAVLKKNFKIVELLLKHNAEVDIVNVCGERPYDLAIRLNDFNIIKILLQYKAEVPIHHIYIIKLKKFPKELKNLFYKNVNVENADDYGYTALHHAVQSNDLSGIRILISKGANVNKLTRRDKYTPLHFATSIECLRILLREDAKVNMPDKYLGSPLYTLALKSVKGPVYSVRREEQQRMIEELIRNDADCSEVIYRGQIALDYGVSVELICGFQDVLKFMALQEPKRHYININHLKLNDGDNVLSLYYTNCLKEVALLKKEKLSDYLTYYDFAAKSIHVLSNYINHKSIVKAFESESTLINKFPMYSEILMRHFKEAKEKRRLCEIASSSLGYVIQGINAGHEATHKIFKFLEIEDLQNLIEAYM